MMKKTIQAVIVLIVLLLLAREAFSPEFTRAPELYGDSAYSYVVRVGAATGVLVFGCDHNTEGPACPVENRAVFVILAHGSECVLHKIAGGPIGNMEQNKLDCRIRWRNELRFDGWIYFRGHTRPLCGAVTEDKLPHLCLLTE